MHFVRQTNAEYNGSYYMRCAPFSNVDSQEHTNSSDAIHVSSIWNF